MFKPSGANTGIFQDISVNIIAVDGVAPKIPHTSQVSYRM